MKAALLVDGRIGITDCFGYIDQIKEIPGREWDSSRKIWIVPVSDESMDMLQKLPCQIGRKVWTKYIEKQKFQQEIAAEKDADEVEPLEPMPIKVKPYRHQIVGYNLALKILGLGAME